ncbi:ABC transporter ATP-binding protein [Rhodovibrio salinarum]|uniref:ABC transporter ATP-binding protein n=1 Tax=Rhodovibrio salinarum TaxID=1087 RepID=A0A934QJL4_9PROT|nr:ABC transporter ATP-binding protein [Rhodovibrio salinarum]MBK1698104.1 ABC transporter ATP-binding protein [Rhodovibrio salinarum]
MSQPVLEAENLAKRFGGVRAVDDVSLALAAGEVLAMIGPNGAGKSTCFNLLNGQVRADGGHVRLHGREITGLPPRKVWRLGVGRTFQVAAVFASMTVLETVQVALLSRDRRLWRLWRRANRHMPGRARELLRQVGMDWAAERTCGTLAYGDVKRVELAIALANDPTVLLMDEPTAGMAAEERGQLMALTQQIARTRKMAVLFTEHDMDVVFGHADRVLVLHQGRVLAHGTPTEVRGEPEVQRVYLGEPNAAEIPAC